MNPLQSTRARHLGVLLQKKRADAFDLAVRFSADMVFTPGVEWNIESKSIDFIWLGSAVRNLSVRDQILVLMECRRVLVPEGGIALIEDAKDDALAALARWAALVGLVACDNDSAGIAWTKAPTDASAQPLVSLLMPSCNPRYFAEALDSAIAQSYAHIEIVICDDCENDAIEKIVESRSSASPIRFIKNPERLRARKNYEKLLALAQGSFLKFLNDDDVLEPECVETLLRPMLANPEITLATSHRWRIDASSRVMEDMPATRIVTDDDILVDGITLANAVIMYGLNFIGEPSTALLRRSAFTLRPHLDTDRAFHFNGEEVRGAVDLAMWSRALVQGDAAFITKRLSRFRSHSEQAQAREDVLQRSVAGIRNLQTQWIRLGLFRRYPPHLLRCKSLTPLGVSAGDWHARPVLSFGQPPESPERAVTQWRAVKQHPFDVDAPVD